MTAGHPVPAGLGAAVAHAVATIARVDGLVIAVLAATVAATMAAGLVVVAHGVAIVAIVLLAGAVHELGHLVAYRALRRDGAAVFGYSGLRASLQRERLPRGRDRVVTASGPLAPLAVALCAAPLVTTVPAEVVAGLLVGAGHALMLLLPSADRHAWRAVAPSPQTGDAPTLGA